ncbi:hypothetical protein [Nocardia vinacea]|uniref:hypothetical protein n=1 Tax=Nocardia vinacea TaxID=96468 RepID=UPI0002F24C16|nr:hypothetical protein [Nocardia vinacea]
MNHQSPDGTVYLLHFERPYRHAKHYTGWTTDLDSRLAEHRAGRGARLLAVIKEAGIGWSLARTWDGNRGRERQLKREGGATRRCPMCGVTPRPAEDMREVVLKARADIAASRATRDPANPVERFDARNVSAQEIDRICSAIESRRAARSNGRERSR